MSKTIIIYGSTTGNTEIISEEIKKGLEKGGKDVTIKNVINADINELSNYDLILLGCSTWGLGELQDDFQPFYGEMAVEHFKGKNVAVFGTGDSDMYPDTFCEAVKILEDKLKECEAEIIADSFAVDGDTENFQDAAEAWGLKLAKMI